jgi:hypothetical protein
VSGKINLCPAGRFVYKSDAIHQLTRIHPSIHASHWPADTEKQVAAMDICPAGASSSPGWGYSYLSWRPHELSTSLNPDHRRSLVCSLLLHVTSGWIRARHIAQQPQSRRPDPPDLDWSAMWPVTFHGKNVSVLHTQSLK